MLYFLFNCHYGYFACFFAYLFSYHFKPFQKRGLNPGVAKYGWYPERKILFLERSIRGVLSLGNCIVIDAASVESVQFVQFALNIFETFADFTSTF